MPTKSPARNTYQIDLRYALSFQTQLGGKIFTEGEGLVVSSNAQETSGEVARTALQFETAAPDWVTAGTSAEIDCLLFVCVKNLATDGGNAYEIAKINDPWNTSYTQAQMMALTLGAWQSGISLLPIRRANWCCFDMSGLDSEYLRNTNGLMIRARTGGNHRRSVHILHSPAPTGRAYLQYSFSDTEEADATVRPELTTEEYNRLGNSTSTYTIDATIKRSVMLPAEDDISLEPAAGTSLSSVLSRKSQWPESWKMDYGSRGSLVLSREDTDIQDYRGELLEVSFTQMYQSEEPAVIAKELAIIGEADRLRNRQEISLECPLKQALNRIPDYRDNIMGFENVEIDGEPSPWVLIDQLVNGGGLRWQRFRYNDIVWIMNRLGTVWPEVTYTTAEIEDETISTLIQGNGIRHALGITRGVDDAIVLWHPAVYRPSMKVWALNMDDTSDSKFRKDRPLDRYNRVTIEGTGGLHGNHFSTGDLPVSEDEVDRVYETGAIRGVEFNDYELARDGIAAQLAQRLTGSRYRLQVTVGMRAAAWECGDQIRVTADCYDLDETVFLITEINGDPTAGKYEVELLHYPDNIGIHSTFEDTGVQGIWRWEKWTNLGVWNGEDNSWLGSGGTWTLSGGMNSIIHADWRGALLGYSNEVDCVEAPVAFAPTSASANDCDLVDFIVGIIGEQDTDPTMFLNQDILYNPLFRFGKAGSDEAVVFGIKRPEQVWTVPPLTRHSCVENQLYVGHTLDWKAVTVTWEDIVLMPAGIGTPWTGDISDTLRDYAVGLQWMNNTLRFYFNQTLIGDITVSKSGFNEAFITTPTYSEHMVGCLRWLLRSDGEYFPAEQLMGKNGIDEYYP